MNEWSELRTPSLTEVRRITSLLVPPSMNFERFPHSVIAETSPACETLGWLASSCCLIWCFNASFSRPLLYSGSRKHLVRDWPFFFWQHYWKTPRSADSVAVELDWNLMTHGDAREGKWRGNRRVEWVASGLALYRRTWCVQHYYHHYHYRWCAHLGCQ